VRLKVRRERNTVRSVRPAWLYFVSFSHGVTL